MNKDLLYYFDKLSPYQRHELGEIQSDFNMSFVIDGTKDSAKVLVYSFNENEIEPNTILWHEKTDSWWIVSRDKVERHLNDNNDFIYFHNLQLLGAIELLNARDLTDCGFNQGRYTNAQFIMRLFKLSNFEFNVVFANQNNLFNQQIVNYVKTFENYTLLSALREFLDGYNMCAKLSFQTSYISGNTYLSYARLLLVNKTGDYTLPTHNISEFDDVRETKTIDRNSFGTIVVSNAENVISGVAKTYPSVGGVSLSSTEYTVVSNRTLNSPVIRLPSNVYKGNWLKIVHHLKVTLTSQGTVTHTFDFEYTGTQASFDKMIEYFAQKILDDTGRQSIVDQFLSSVDDTWKHNLDLASCVTLYNGNSINPETGEIVKGKDVPYLATMLLSEVSQVNPIPFVFCDKDTKNCLPNKKQGICWERGSNIISGFELFSGAGSLQTWNNDYGYAVTLFQFQDSSNTVTVRATNQQTLKDVNLLDQNLAKAIKKISFIINYIPMTDLKVKVDNQQEKRDIHLYNQNGKLTDNIALSKLLNSYSKEISSNKITRYKAYRNYALVPKVGSFVTTTNGDYVVNNVSLDFSQNEDSNNDFGYFIECEITMSKYCAAKSLNVNPNTNIRDYGIPQNFNVKRKQLYRDYYELSYSSDPNADSNYYLKPSQVFDLDGNPNEDSNFICVIKCSYGELIEGQDSWYYQLETTIYNMNKMLYAVCDFNDNNIIGYASQNVHSGFDISRVISGSTDNLNTPISYVDSKGETLGIRIKFCNKEQTTTAYDNYLQQQQGGDTYEGSLYNYSCFIPQDIYENIGANDYTFIIEEPYYEKDAIEVPVFEYACQVEDSKDVLIGDNIFPSQKGNVIYMYSFVMGEHLNQSNVIANNHITYSAGSETATLENTAKITLLDESTMLIRLFEKRYYFADTMLFGDDTSVNFVANKDYAIFRHTFDLMTNQETNVELVMIAKKVQPTLLNQVVDIIINHYKLN